MCGPEGAEKRNTVIQNYAVRRTDMQNLGVTTLAVPQL